MRQKYVVIIEFTCFAGALVLLYAKLGILGIIGLFLAFVGFELHLIYHRRDREKRIRNKNKLI